MKFTDTLRRISTAVPPVDLVYCSHAGWPSPRAGPLTRPLQIAVLDSSFNPPTLAHLALANHLSSVDAVLLLLSVRNADKNIKSTDATHEQRADMMVELAQDIAGGENVAVGLIDEPTFVGKSRMLQEFLTQKSRITFLVGIDTLRRIFSPRYYASDANMHAALREFFSTDGSRIVSASREASSFPSSDTSPENLEQQIRDFLSSCQLPSDSVTTIQLAGGVDGLSSSKVRKLVEEGNEEWKSMVTNRIVEYITKSGLYTNTVS